MSGGLMQIVAQGAQDKYLTVDPEITFFKSMYRRHTNFAVESIEQTFNGAVGSKGKVSATISRNGDLVHRMWLEVMLPALAEGEARAENDVYKLIDNVSVEIGGTRVDRHYGDWMKLHDDLTTETGARMENLKDVREWDEETRAERRKYKVTHDKVESATTDFEFTAAVDQTDNTAKPDPKVGDTFTVAGATKSDGNAHDSTPHVFTITEITDNNNGTLTWKATAASTTLAKIETAAVVTIKTTPPVEKKLVRIPLSFWFCKDAGQALPLIALQYHEVKVNVEFTDALPPGAKVSLWVDYVYLDTAERQRFARSSHEYLIEQVQTTGQEALAGTMDRVRLNFNHPVKELVWTTEKSLESAKLKLNGHDRFAERDAAYFKQVQQYQHHTGKSDDANVYSFALEPEKLQPSGTCNFSRIDNAELELHTSAAGSATIYAVNYNVLRIKNGMGGLAYSN
jgi:hypothetical protein